MRNFEQRKRDADRYLDRQCAIVADSLGIDRSGIRISTPAEDFHGADLYTDDGRSVGLRVRSSRIVADHPDEFCVRLLRGPDGRHERDRIIDGCPDLYFCFTADDGGTIIGWRCLDLSVFRRAAANGFRGIDASYHDSTDSTFIAYSIPSFAVYGSLVVAGG